MVSSFLGKEALEKDLEELILQKTEGIPFFIEEFIRSLNDLKAIERHNGTYRLSQDIQVFSIPSTIQDVIMARVYALPEDAKEVLQTGTVIGREFNYELIKKVTVLPQQKLLSCLSILKDSELLYERGIFPESTYINMANKYLTSWRNYDIGRAWKKLMHENSALMHNSNFVIKSFDFESRVESIARSVQLLVLAVPSAAHGGPFTKTEAKKAFKLSSEAARLEAAAP
jgi:hypothetical protein